MTNPPAWLEQLASDAAGLLCPVDMLAPVGCHVHFDEEESVWEVTVFAARTETFGGPRDGQLTPSRFELDLAALAGLLSDVTSFSWCALPLGDEDDLGAHVCVEGTCCGKAVRLRVPAAAPPSVPVGRRVDVLRQEITEVW